METGSYILQLTHLSLRSQSASPWQLKENDAVLEDGHRLSQRQKQIDFGKNTPGYEIYIQTIPK